MSGGGKSEAWCSRHDLPARGSCERCGVFICANCRPRHCWPCAVFLQEQALAANRPNALGQWSLLFFISGLCFAFIDSYPLPVLAFPAGVVTGVMSLRRRGKRLLGIVGLVLNALVIIAFVIVSALAGWAA